MHTPSTGARALAIISGSALVAAAAWLTIDATGGPATPHAKLVAATALSLVAGAIALGQARGLMFCTLLFGLLCAEAYGLIATSERIVAARDQAQAPVRAAAAAHQAATARVTAAQAASDRAAQAAIERSAARDCQSNCRKLLDAAKAAATGELETAREELAVTPAPAEAAPLAARLGLPAWALDLAAAALGSLAANGLGCALIAFAVHARATASPGAPRPSSHQAGRAPALDFVAAAAELTAPELPDDPPPPGQAADRARMVAEFVSAYQSRHGRPPRHRDVMAATGLSKATASRYRSRALAG